MSGGLPAGHLGLAGKEARTMDDHSAEIDVDICVHHWILERPESGDTAALCKKCGAHRLFTPRPKWRHGRPRA